MSFDCLFAPSSLESSGSMVKGKKEAPKKKKKVALAI
jgi:hypothetical protein